MQTDEELKATLDISENDGIIFVNFLKQVVDPEENVRRAQFAVGGVFEILDKDAEANFKILVDMSLMGESHIPMQAHKIYLSALKKEQVRKVAIVGDFKAQLKVLSFITPFIVGEGKKVVWFPNKAEAMLWFEKVTL